jgi:hypothetical protein
MNSFSLLLQQAPPDTTGYMIAGFTVIFGVMGLYLISIAVRRRSLKQDMQVLLELEDNAGDK